MCVQLQLGRLMKLMLLTVKKPTAAAPLGPEEIPMRLPCLNNPPTSEDPFMPEWFMKVTLGWLPPGSRLVALVSTANPMRPQPTTRSLALV